MSYNRNGNGNAGHDPISARDRARAELRARNAVPAPALHGAAGEATTARLAVSRPSRSRATVAVVASLGLVGAGLFGIAQASSTVVPQAGLSAEVIRAQVRSTVVDLLMLTGLTYAEACVVIPAPADGPDDDFAEGAT